MAISGLKSTLITGASRGIDQLLQAASGLVAGKTSIGFFDPLPFTQ